MKIINWITDSFLILGLKICSIGSYILAMLVLLFMLFKWNPYYAKKGGFEGGWDLKSGVGVKIVKGYIERFPDTTFDFRTAKGKSGTTHSLDKDFFDKKIGDDTIIQLDSTWANYMISYTNNEKTKPSFIANNASIPSFYVRLKPTTIASRYLLYLPTLLELLLYGFAFGQFYKFLRAIQLGKSFDYTNYKRLSNIGFSLIGYQLFLYAYQLTQNYYVDLIFQSTLSNFRNIINLNGVPEKYNFYYLIAGLIFIILAKAFKKGYQIQQEQDLTI